MHPSRRPTLRRRSAHFDEMTVPPLALHSLVVAVGTQPFPLHSFFPAQALPAVAHPLGPLQALFAEAHAPCPLQELRPPQWTRPAVAVGDLPSAASVP